MGKRSRTKARDQVVGEGEVGPRQPCPCGSGRRYKACHGSAAGAPGKEPRVTDRFPTDDADPELDQDPGQSSSPSSSLSIQEIGSASRSCLVIIVLVVILVLFGGAQLPKLAKNLGKAGDLVDITVEGDVIDAVSVEGLTDHVTLDPDSPAMLELFADAPGQYPITLLEADRRIGTLDVKER